MDILGTIKKFFGMNDSSSRNDRDDEDDIVGDVNLSAMDRQKAAQEVAHIIDSLNINDVNIHIKGKFWNEARETLDEVSIDSYKEALNDLNDLTEEDFEAVNGDMSLVAAGKKYINDMLSFYLKDIHKLIDAGEAGNNEEYETIQEELDKKDNEITDAWNNALVAFVEKHNIPWESQF